MNHQHILTASPKMLYHGSWVKYSVGYMSHGSLKVTHRLPCRSPHFCFPWRRPCDWLSRYVLHGWKDNSMLVKHLAACIVHICLQQFPSYSNRKCKKSQFSCTAAHVFVSPGDAPATITQYVAQMERQFNGCQTPCSMYLSILNSFRVIRCLSQCVTPKSLFLPRFCFRWRRPCRSHAKCCMDGRRIWCLQIVSLHVPI